MSGKATKDVQIGGNIANIEGYDTDPYFIDLPSHIQALSSLYSVADHVCGRDGIILDVGANIGVSGTMMSYIVPEGFVYCAEPSPKNVALLQRNLGRNAKAKYEVIAQAIGSEPGVVKFHESNQCGAWNHVSADTMLTVSDATTTVMVNTVDEITRERNLDRLDFIKIDVEGFESEVLKGMRNTVDRLNPVVHMEINSVTTILVADQSPRDLLRRFTDLMGNVYAYGDDGRLMPLDTGDAQHLFLFKNLTERGCIDDVVGCRDASRLAQLVG